MKRFLFCLAAAAGLLSLSARTVYDFSVKDADGRTVTLSRYKGKVLFIVNTATQCGFTPQYKELEALYQNYAKDGLEILDFPCNQFGGQAPGTMQEIRQFCTERYDTHFPQFEKIDVNGSNASPLFTHLKSQKGFGGFDPTDRIGQLLDKMLREKNPDYAKSSDIMWNFTKFLIDRDGRVAKRYEPTEKIQVIEDDIRKFLQQPASSKKNKR